MSSVDPEAERAQQVIERLLVDPVFRGEFRRAVLSLRYYDRLSKLTSHVVVLGAFILFFIVLLLPVIFALVIPMISRARYGTREVNRDLR